MNDKVEVRADSGASEEEYIEALEELLEMWRGRADIAVPVIDGRLAKAMMIYSLVEHAAALSDSVILLVENNHHVQAVGLIRSTMECSVTAAWMAVTPKAADAMFHEWARGRVNMLEEWAKYRAEDLSGDVAEASRTVGAWKDGALEAARKFWKLCSELEGGSELYVYYRLMCGYVHAGAGITNLYSEETPITERAPAGYAFRHPAKFGLEIETLGVQVMMLLLGLSAWDLLDKKHPNAAALDAFAERFDMGRTIRRTVAE